MATPTGTKVDAQRARLRAEGYTEAEISQILINQASGIGSQQPAGAAPVQGNMTGVLGNASAALSHARGTIPVLKGEVANLSNPTAPRSSRAKSAAVVVSAAVVAAVLGYAIYQEWQIHIVNAPITAAAEAQKAAAAAAVAEEVAKGEQAKARAAYDVGVAFPAIKNSTPQSLLPTTLDPPASETGMQTLMRMSAIHAAARICKLPVPIDRTAVQSDEIKNCIARVIMPKFQRCTQGDQNMCAALKCMTAADPDASTAATSKCVSEELGRLAAQ